MLQRRVSPSIPNDKVLIDKELLLKIRQVYCDMTNEDQWGEDDSFHGFYLRNQTLNRLGDLIEPIYCELTIKGNEDE